MTVGYMAASLDIGRKLFFIERSQHINGTCDVEKISLYKGMTGKCRAFVIVPPCGHQNILRKTGLLTGFGAYLAYGNTAVCGYPHNLGGKAGS